MLVKLRMKIWALFWWGKCVRDWKSHKHIATLIISDIQVIWLRFEEKLRDKLSIIRIDNLCMCLCIKKDEIFTEKKEITILNHWKDFTNTQEPQIQKKHEHIGGNNQNFIIRQELLRMSHTIKRIFLEDFFDEICSQQVKDEHASC